MAATEMAKFFIQNRAEICKSWQKIEFYSNLSDLDVGEEIQSFEKQFGIFSAHIDIQKIQLIDFELEQMVREQIKEYPENQIYNESRNGLAERIDTVLYELRGALDWLVHAMRSEASRSLNLNQKLNSIYSELRAKATTFILGSIINEQPPTKNVSQNKQESKQSPRKPVDLSLSFLGCRSFYISNGQNVAAYQLLELDQALKLNAHRMQVGYNLFQPIDLTELQSAKYKPGLEDNVTKFKYNDGFNITAPLVGLRFFGQAVGPHIHWLATEFSLNLAHIGLVQGIKLSTPFVLGTGNLGNHEANLLWNRGFNDTIDVLQLHEGPNEVELDRFRNFWSALFVKMIRKTSGDMVNHMSSDCLNHVISRILKEPHTEITRSNFSHDKLVYRRQGSNWKGLSFYEWLSDWARLIRQYLLPEWNEGIINFCSRTDVEALLSNHPRNLFVRISDYYVDNLVFSWCNNEGTVIHDPLPMEKVKTALIPALLQYRPRCDWLVSKHWPMSFELAAIMPRPQIFPARASPPNLPPGYIA